MASPSVLVVYKKSAYQIYVEEHGDRHTRELIRRGAAVVRHLRAAHREHEGCLGVVRDVLAKLPVRTKFRYRSRRLDANGYDLVITVGGDGTLFEAARIVDATPVLSVNSSPSRSIAAFSGCTAVTFERVVTRFLGGDAPITNLWRLAISVDDPPARDRAVNDALFCHRNPAAMSRYLLALGGHSEEQRSSGVWVASAAGSTAAIHSAGGRVVPLASGKIQFLVREPYVPPGRAFQMRRGLIRDGGHLTITSQMRQGVIFVDGPHREIAWPLGATARIETDPQPLRLIAVDRKRFRR